MTTTSSTSCFLNNIHLVKSGVLMVKASESSESQSTESSASEAEREDYYEVELVQPYGLKFVKGRNGGTYIDAIAPGGSADSTGLFTVGDKVVATRFLVLFISINLLSIIIIFRYIASCLCLLSEAVMFENMWLN